MVLTDIAKISVPKQILKEVYDYPVELDEPTINSSTEVNEIYHDDRESEAIPPAPKLGAGKTIGGLSVNASVDKGTKFETTSSDDTFLEG